MQMCGCLMGMMPQKYNILYMHDGHMLFDSATTYKNTTWKEDDVVTKLLNEKKIKELIVICIWNADKTRNADYFPQKPYQALTQDQRDTETSELLRAGKSTEKLQPLQSIRIGKFAYQVWLKIQRL